MIFYSIINEITKSTQEINKVFYNKKEAEEFADMLNKKSKTSKYTYKEFEFNFTQEELDKNWKSYKYDLDNDYQKIKKNRIKFN